MKSAQDLIDAINCLPIDECQRQIANLDNHIDAMKEHRELLVNRCLELNFPYRIGQTITVGDKKGRVLAIKPLWHEVNQCELRVRLLKKDGSDSKFVRSVNIYGTKTAERMHITILN